MLTLQELSDREEIREVLARWTLIVDTHDWAAYRSVVTEDADIDFSAIGAQGRTVSENLTYIEGAATRFAGWQHHLTNTSFLELTDTEARTRTACFAPTVQKDGRVFFVGVWYHDTLRRTEEGWKVSARTTERVYFHNLPENFEPAAAAPAMP
jgi:hypothetical protein